jgi:Second Messenger Oligonucleotide or Dinucleotide Synthetase domain
MMPSQSGQAKQTKSATSHLDCYVAVKTQPQREHATMYSLSTHFRLLQQRIEPTAERAATAQRMPKAVRDYLKGHKELTTTDPHTRLGGSYGRDTSNGNIKDVDILVFVHEDWQDEPIADLLCTLKGALYELPEALDDCGSVTLRQQRRSVNVFLTEHDLYLDVVPVVLTTNDPTDRLEVPDRTWDKWVGTQPLGYAGFLSQLNAEHKEKVVRLVKMTKHWRDVHFERRRPKSYWLESLVVQHIRRGWVLTDGKGYALLFADLLDSIHEKFTPVLEQKDKTPKIPDAMLSNNVAWNWERSHFETFMRRLDESRKWARRAVQLDEKEDNQETAVELWQKVFGDKFPTSPEASALEALEAKGQLFGRESEAGKLLVEPSGHVHMNLPTGVIATTSPAKRFFGD